MSRLYCLNCYRIFKSGWSWSNIFHKRGYRVESCPHCLSIHNISYDETIRKRLPINHTRRKFKGFKKRFTLMDAPQREPTGKSTKDEAIVRNKTKIFNYYRRK